MHYNCAIKDPPLCHPVCTECTAHNTSTKRDFIVEI